METIFLVGSEEVKNAGYSIARAAESMGYTSGNMQVVLEAHQRFLDDWLLRFETILEARSNRERD